MKSIMEFVYRFKLCKIKHTCKIKTTFVKRARIERSKIKEGMKHKYTKNKNKKRKRAET
jgi:hypothetical protein